MTKDQKPLNRNLGFRLTLAAVAMFAFGFALVPLYDIFCEITGIRVPIEATDAASIIERPEESRSIRLQFVANTNNSAPWEFRPVSDSAEIQTGLLLEAEYYARNLTTMPLDGVATPDVRPAEAARYFKKIECFCFTEQHFEAGEARNLQVRYLVEPDLPEHIDTITLSYTLFAKPTLASNN